MRKFKKCGRRARTKFIRSHRPLEVELCIPKNFLFVKVVSVYQLDYFSSQSQDICEQMNFKFQELCIIKIYTSQSQYNTYVHTYDNHNAIKSDVALTKTTVFVTRFPRKW